MITLRNFGLAILLTLAVAGCSTFQSQGVYYDNNEYEMFADVETRVQLIQEDCGQPEVVVSQLPELRFLTEKLYTYAFYIPGNVEVYKMAEILRNDVREFKAQYDKDKATPLYCKLKTKAFIQKARVAMEAVGSKLR